jgi:HK97 family phage portal protein
MDNRTDQEKEQSPYFDHWEYTGNILQRPLKIGPKKAIFRTITEAEAKVIAAESEDSEIYLTPPDYKNVMVEIIESGEKKAVTYQRFLVLQEELEGNLERLYKKSPWVYRCIELRAMALATMPWAIFSGETKLEHGPAIRLLKEVNPETNWEDLIASTERDLDIYGFAYWLKARPGSGEIGMRTSGAPIQLKRLNPAYIKIKADRNENTIYFEQTIDSGNPMRIARKNIVFFKYYDPIGDLTSVSPLQTCMKAVKIEIEANKCLMAFFENKAMPDVVMTSKEVIQQSELRKLMEMWKREFGGSKNQHKTGFISHGFEPKEMGYAPNELALSEIRQEIRRDITCSFGVPFTLISGGEATNYGTLKTQRRSLYTEIIIPVSEYLQGVINAELMSEFEGTPQFRFLPEKLDVMQEDKDRSAESVARLVEAGVIKPEVGAVAVGFKAEDAGIGKQAAPSFFPKALHTKAEEKHDDGDLQTELLLWKKKAVNRLKDDKSLDFKFNCKYITPLTYEAVLTQLKEAKTADEIDLIFDEAEKWRGYP